MFTHLEKHLLLALLVAIWVCVLVLLTLGRLQSFIPEPPTLPAYAFRTYRTVKGGPIGRLLAPTVYSSLRPATQEANPFYSIQLYPPTPPPPKTRKVEVLYQGFFMTSHGEKYFYLQVENELVVGPVGVRTAGGLVVADMNTAGLTLKDEAGKETYLPFNEKQTLEVPIK
jgi:hypothetical protein